MRDLPQGRYVHLSAANARLVLRDSRDPRPALEEANLPLKHWRYRDDGRVEFASPGTCHCAWWCARRAIA